MPSINTPVMIMTVVLSSFLIYIIFIVSAIIIIFVIVKARATLDPLEP